MERVPGFLCDHSGTHCFLFSRPLSCLHNRWYIISSNRFYHFPYNEIYFLCLSLIYLLWSISGWIPLFLFYGWEEKKYKIFPSIFPTYTCFASTICAMRGGKPEQLLGCAFSVDRSTQDRIERILKR